MTLLWGTQTPSITHLVSAELEATTLEPRPNPNARLGLEPSARLGLEPNTRLGLEPNARLGLEPNARLGLEPNTRLGLEAELKPEIRR